MKPRLITDYIECAKGWQAEVSINAMWTAYTKCVKSKDLLDVEVDKLKEMLGINLIE